VALPFWQRSLSSLEYDELAAFIDERVPEGEHLEYKQPSAGLRSLLCSVVTQPTAVGPWYAIRPQSQVSLTANKPL